MIQELSHHIYPFVDRNIRSLVEAGKVQQGQIFVVGVSTSEILGEHIGTAGAFEIAEPIYVAIEKFAKDYGIHVAYQCCEHLNRALVIEATSWEAIPHLEQVSVIPDQRAGGSMATYAYYHMKSPLVVESIQAHFGLDIGDTLMGMHLRKVAVPFRPPIREIGKAHVTMAYTRPKLIGGARAIYEKKSIFI
jgi:uncharacterized protein (TIGR01440 family)